MFYVFYTFRYTRTLRLIVEGIENDDSNETCAGREKDCGGYDGTA